MADVSEEHAAFFLRKETRFVYQENRKQAGQPTRRVELTLICYNEGRLSDLALALLEDDNGDHNCDAHAEYLDAQHHSAQQVVVSCHAG